MDSLEAKLDEECEQHALRLKQRQDDQDQWVKASILRLYITMKHWPIERQIEHWRNLSMACDHHLAMLIPPQEETPAPQKPTTIVVEQGNPFVFPDDF